MGIIKTAIIANALSDKKCHECKEQNPANDIIATESDSSSASIFVLIFFIIALVLVIVKLREKDN